MASGIITNLPSESSKPMNAIFAPLELYFILIPRSRLSSEVPSPNSKIGSAIDTVVELTVVVVPETTRSPEIVKVPAELKDIFSVAASEDPNIKLILDALEVSEKSPSETTLIAPASKSWSAVPLPSSGAINSNEPKTSFN